MRSVELQLVIYYWIIAVSNIELLNCKVTVTSHCMYSWSEHTWFPPYLPGGGGKNKCVVYRWINNTVMTVRGTIHFHTSVFELSIFTLSRFFTVSTLITMAFSLSTYCEQILLFYMFLIWLKRALERGWEKNNVKNYFWYIFVQIECKKIIP